MKIALITLGCPKNLVDAEVMMGLLDEAGHALTGDPTEADVAIVNTCSFISAAVAESRETIEECLVLKSRGALAAVVVAGCLPQRYGRETLKMFPDVDAVVGCSDFAEIAGVVEAVSGGERPFVVNEPRSLYDHMSPRILGTPSHLAYVKIAEGCDNRCAYCTIPSIRGRLRSRSPDSVVSEATALRQLGIRELNIIAQDTTAYGTDIASSDAEIAGLLRRLADVGVPWLRLLYTHPAHIGAELLAVLAEGTVLPYLDVPIQHISDGVLSSMGRGIDGDGIRRLIDEARRVVPDLTIRTTVIVGYPGETESDFRELVEFVRTGRVDHLGIFEYSPEDGTPAAKLPGQVDARTAAERAEHIHEIAVGMAARRGLEMVGRSVEVLCDAPGSGRTSGQAWELDGDAIWEPGGDGPTPGTFFTARVVGAGDFDLVVEPAEDGEPAEGGEANGPPETA